MTNKTYLTWIHTRNWCEMNPEKTAAVVTPFGRFEIVYYENKPKETKLESVEFDHYDWIEKFFREGDSK